MRIRVTPGFFLTVVLYYIAERAGLFQCVVPAVVVHELGHTVMIAACGGRVEGMTLGAGGLCLDYSGNFSHKQEIFIALAGSAANFLCAFVCAVFCRRGNDALSYAAGVQVCLAVWNLLPVHDMDGGTVLKETLHSFLSWEHAELLFSRISLYFSCGILIFGLYIALKTRYNISVFCLGSGLTARSILSDKSDKRICKWIV